MSKLGRSRIPIRRASKHYEDESITREDLLARVEALEYVLADIVHKTGKYEVVTAINDNGEMRQWYMPTAAILHTEIIERAKKVLRNKKYRRLLNENAYWTYYRKDEEIGF